MLSGLVFSLYRGLALEPGEERRRGATWRSEGEVSIEFPSEKLLWAKQNSPAFYSALSEHQGNPLLPKNKRQSKERAMFPNKAEGLKSKLETHSTHAKDVNQKKAWICSFHPILLLVMTCYLLRLTLHQVHRYTVLFAEQIHLL